MSCIAFAKTSRATEPSELRFDKKICQPIPCSRKIEREKRPRLTKRAEESVTKSIVLGVPNMTETNRPDVFGLLAKIVFTLHKLH